MTVLYTVLYPLPAVEWQLIGCVYVLSVFVSKIPRKLIHASLQNSEQTLLTTLEMINYVSTLSCTSLFWHVLYTYFYTGFKWYNYSQIVP